MKVSTKLNKDSESVKTNVTIDFTGTTREELEKLATKSVVIMAQAEWRADGVIPASADLIAHDLCNRERKAREKLTPAQIVAKLTPEQLRAAMIAAGMQVPEL